MGLAWTIDCKIVCVRERERDAHTHTHTHTAKQNRDRDERGVRRRRRRGEERAGGCRYPHFLSISMETSEALRTVSISKRLFTKLVKLNKWQLSLMELSGAMYTSKYYPLSAI